MPDKQTLEQLLTERGFQELAREIVGDNAASIRQILANQFMCGNNDEELMFQLSNPASSTILSWVDKNWRTIQLDALRRYYDRTDNNAKAFKLKVWLGVFSIVAVVALMFSMVFITIDPAIAATISLVAGNFIGNLNLVYGYFFGSSEGSSEKTELLATFREKSTLTSGQR